MTDCKTKAQAEQRGRKLLKMMKSKGWELDVWHNLGWCYALRSRKSLLGTWTMPNVFPDEQRGKPTTYSCIFNGVGADPCSDYFRDPNKAVQQLVDRACEWQRRQQKRWNRFMAHHGLSETKEKTCQKPHKSSRSKKPRT